MEKSTTNGKSDLANIDAKPESAAQNKNGDNITESEMPEDVQEGNPIKEPVPLPEIGKRFYIDGQLYKVTYVNIGRKRFSAEIANS